MQQAVQHPSTDFAPRDVYYRGYRIVWDVRPVPGTCTWTGKAAVVIPPGVQASYRVHRVGEQGGFASEGAARDQLIRAAMDWIEASTGCEYAR